MIRHLVYLFLFPAILNAQENISTLKNNKVYSAINWSKGLNWQQIKDKAKAENKFILVDCYASWCGPCKKMDKEVFVNDSVGYAVNTNFIAIEVQMDTSKIDNEFVKDWYADAHLIAKQHHVGAFPTFLFFSPTGEIVHKSSGYMDAKRFISLTEDAVNPGRQYYTLLKNYEGGEIEYENLPYLVSLASHAGEQSLAKHIALDYINNYMLKLSPKKIFTKENLSYITTYVNSSKERAFQLIYENTVNVNKVLNRPGFAKDWIHYIITVEDIQPIIFLGNEAATSVDWNILTKKIKRKYGDYYADRTILDAKSRWYGVKKEWPSYTKFTVDFVEKYGANMGDFNLATKAWSVFLYSSNKDELTSAITWTRRILNRSKDSSNIIPAAMDSYANLFYKIDYLFNKKKTCPEAIALENLALELAKKFKVYNFQKSFTTTIEKMEKGIKTW